MNPADARARGLQTGQVIKILMHAEAVWQDLVSEDMMPGVIELPTGAWFDPQQVDGEALEVHGNPNVLTPDIGTSKLAQGCSAHTCMVEVIAFVGQLPADRGVLSTQSDGCPTCRDWRLTSMSGVSDTYADH